MYSCSVHKPCSTRLEAEPRKTPPKVSLFLSSNLFKVISEVDLFLARFFNVSNSRTRVVVNSSQKEFVNTFFVKPG